MTVTEYDNRDNAGYVSFYTKRGKVILNFAKNTVSVYQRLEAHWKLLDAWELNR